MTPEDAVVGAAASIPQLDGHSPWLEVTESRFGAAADDPTIATGYIEISCGGSTYAAYVIAHPDGNERPAS